MVEAKIHYDTDTSTFVNTPTFINTPTFTDFHLIDTVSVADLDWKRSGVDTLDSFGLYTYLITIHIYDQVYK